MWGHFVGVVCGIVTLLPAREHVLDRVPFLRRGHARPEMEPVEVSQSAPSVS
jgi:hypothetical protein